MNTSLPLAQEEPPSQRTVIIVNTGSLKKRFIFQQLKKIPHLTVVVLNNTIDWAKPYVDDWILADTRQHDTSLRAVLQYAKTHAIDGVLTFWEDDVLLTSKIAEKLGLPGIPWSAAYKARNKFEFRNFCRNHNLPAPRHQLVTSVADLETLSSELHFPVVIKPVFGSSSAYVVKADTLDRLKEHYTSICNNLSLKVESALGDGLQLLVEEYIDGEEVDIDMLLQHGKVKFWSMSDNPQTQEPYFVEMGMSIPSALPDSSQQALYDMAEQVLEQLGVTDGCIHFEAKHTDTGPVPIEVNLRMGGDDIYWSVKAAWGVDLIEQAVKIACNEYFLPIKRPEEPRCHILSQDFLATTNGVLSSYTAPKQFPKELRVNDFHFFKEVGDAVFVPPRDYEYLGWITVQGDNAADAENNLKEALALVSYEIIPFSSFSATGKTKRPLPQSVARITAEGQERLERINRLDRKAQRQLTVAVACNSFSVQDGAVEAELTSVGKNIENTLKTRGYRTLFIDFNDLDTAWKLLRSSAVDVVFNVAERINGSSLLEPHVASLLDSLEIPYTGSNPMTLALCIDKIKVKKLLTYHQIPTAKWDYLYSLDDSVRDDLTFPLVVKPSNTDNSIGISQNSVVTTPEQLQTQIRYVLQELQRPVLIEEYLPGDEYDVSIIGNTEQDLRVLPLSRSVFDALPENEWHIYPYEAKFGDYDAFKHRISVQQPPKNVSHKLLSLISEMALDTYSILDAHDYARVEIKLDAQDNPHVLELNPNPSINIGNSLPLVAELAGLDYGDLLEEIIALAVTRYRHQPPYHHLQPTLG